LPHPSKEKEIKESSCALISGNIPAFTWEKHKKPQTGQPIFWPRLEHMTFRMPRDTTHWALVFSINLSNVIILFMKLLVWMFTI
jgi:hypothetical protein